MGVNALHWIPIAQGTAVDKDYVGEDIKSKLFNSSVICKNIKERERGGGNIQDGFPFLQHLE